MRDVAVHDGFAVPPPSDDVSGRAEIAEEETTPEVRRRSVEVEHREYAARSQYPRAFTQCEREVGVSESVAAGNEVGAAVVRWKRRQVAVQKFHAFGDTGDVRVADAVRDTGDVSPTSASRVRTGACQLEHFLGGINARHTRRASCRSDREGQITGPAREIQHVVHVARGRQCVREECAFPVRVHAEGEEPRERVVARRDEVEHRGDERGLQGWVGQVALQVQVAQALHGRILIRTMAQPPKPFTTTGSASGVLPLPHAAHAARAPDDTATPPLWAVVFAGGIGSRFWPIATPTDPKPVLALVGGRPLIAETVGRLDPLIPADRVLVVTSADIAPAIRAVLPAVPAHNILVEARPLGTAAALAWGVSEVRRRADPNTPVCAMHADLAAAFPSLLRDALLRATLAALREHTLVAIGVRPTRAEASFGYIEPGPPLDPTDGLAQGGPADVTQFTEKPGPSAAERLAKSGALWHSGIVLGGAQEFLDALHLYVPEVAVGLTPLAAGDVEEFVRHVRPVSIERGLLERMGRLLVTAPEFGWDDVGTWAGLRRVRELDDDGNGALGDAHFVDASGNVVHAEAGTVVMFGVSQLLVVTRPGLTFVTTLERAADLKSLLDSLPGSARINPGSLGA